MVQVYMPEQELNEGTIIFKVIEPKVTGIEFPDGRYDKENIENSLPALIVGETPNTHDLAQNLSLANQSTARQTTIEFAPSGKENELIASVVIDEESLWNVALSVDNTGTESTGEYRFGVSAQYENIFNRDDVLSGSFTTSEKGDSVKVYGLGYHRPLYGLHSTFDMFAGFSDVDSGVVEDLFNVSGKGTVFGARFGKILPKTGNYTHNLSLGLDYRAYDNAAILIGGSESVVPDVTVHPYSLAYMGQWSSANRLFGFNVQWVKNIPGGENGEDADFTNSRTGSVADYSLWRFGAQYAQAFEDDWQSRFVMTGQYTQDALVAGEQFGVGGANSVRGYGERDLSNDKGVQGNIELYTPDFARWLRFSGKTRGLAFYDFGFVSRNYAQAGESTSDSIGGVGAGLRVSYKDIWKLNMDAAYALEAGGGTQDGDSDFHISLEYMF
jgi:hemolysin activation/secretion protein